MASKLTPAFIQLTQDACLKAFWRKPALRAFLRQSGISEQRLATWHSDESKRVFLQRLFPALLEVVENKGHVVILAMARSLAEMKYFPDLENWEDSTEKINSAKQAIARLKIEVEKLDSIIRNDREREQKKEEARKRQLDNIANSQSLEKLASELSKIVDKQGTQEGGYDFEKWFYELANFDEISSRPPYKVQGRQIDGSLTLDGTTFLIETKFTKEQIGAPDIDVFMSKIVRKADNTMGVFISIAGFSSVAITEASRDRTPMILMDHSHFYNLILPGLISLSDAIRRIKRHASQTGEAYLCARDFSQ